MAYASASTNINYSKDDDEIDLDDNDDHMGIANADETADSNVFGDSKKQTNTSIANDVTVQSVEEVNVVELNEVVESRTLSKSEAMKLRMRQLKQKMNQARQLNQQAMREEVENSISGSGISKQSKKKINSITHTDNQSSHAIRLAQEHGDIDPKLLLQPAYENISKQQKKQEKEELNEFAINDYHNPEGQYRNYQRNIKSISNNANYTAADHPSAAGIYEPTDMLTTTTDEIKKQRDGAHRISQELQRRYDKRQTKERKRKQEEIRQELNDTSSSTTAAASGINLRNQKFNQKIARTYDKTTCEIRHNLERGTAL